MDVFDGGQKARSRLYIPALDGLRFLAFLLVFFHHFSRFPNAILSDIHDRGWIGVEIFFVISALLFFRLLGAEAAKTGSICILCFYIRRLLRLYPLMIAFSVAMLLIYGQTDSIAFGRILALAAFADNFAAWFNGYNDSVPFTPHLWTISYEFQIYVLIPLAFSIYAAIGKQKFFVVLGLVGIVCMVARLAFVLLAVPHPLIWVTPFLRPESTLLGIAVGLGFFDRLPKLLVVSTLLSSGAAIALMPEIDVIGWSTVLIYPALAVFCGSLAWLAINSDHFRSLLSCAPVVFLGKISFGLYVFQFLAIHLVSIASPSWSLEGQFAEALLLTGVFAAGSYYILERPFLMLKRRVSVVEAKAV